MADELVERLLDWPYQGETMAHEAADRIEQLTAERERLALTICGGEDAPGYANAQTVETLEHVAKQNQQYHGATINSLRAAEVERDRLREALTRLLAPFGNDACHYDHHGYCQEHFIEADCCVAHARAALKGETP